MYAHYYKEMQKKDPVYDRIMFAVWESNLISELRLCDKIIAKARETAKKEERMIAEDMVVQVWEEKRDLIRSLLRARPNHLFEEAENEKNI